MYKTLLDERADLLAQAARIERAIVALGFPLPESAPANVAAAQPDREPAGDRQPGGLGDDGDAQALEGGTKAMLLRILQEHPNRKFGAPAALEALRAEGWTTTSSNPRNVVVSTLGKLARDGSIDNLGQGVYAYIPSPPQGAAGEPSRERATPSGDAADEENAPRLAYVGGSEDDPPF